jgi:hypothetical protein
MPVVAISPVRIWHTSKRFYFGIDMFYHNTPARKPLVTGLFPLGQLMLFTWLYRNETVCMVLFYSPVSKTGVKRDRITDGFSYSIFIYLKVMLAAFGFRYINDAQAVSLNDSLRLERVPFFFLNNTLFGPFWEGLPSFP